MDYSRYSQHPRALDTNQRASRRGIPRRVPEDVLEELHQLAGDVAAVFDSRKPEENEALESFEQVMDALENKMN